MRSHFDYSFDFEQFIQVLSEIAKNHIQDNEILKLFFHDRAQYLNMARNNQNRAHVNQQFFALAQKYRLQDYYKEWVNSQIDTISENDVTEAIRQRNEAITGLKQLRTYDRLLENPKLEHKINYEIDFQKSAKKGYKSLPKNTALTNQGENIWSTLTISDVAPTRDLMQRYSRLCMETRRLFVPKYFAETKLKRLLHDYPAFEYDILKQFTTFLSIELKWVLPSPKDVVHKNMCDSQKAQRELLDYLKNQYSLLADENTSKAKVPAKFYALYHWIRIKMGNEKPFEKDEHDRYRKNEIEDYAKQKYPNCSKQGFYRAFKDLDITNLTAIARSCGKDYKDKIIQLSGNDANIISHLKNYPN